MAQVDVPLVRSQLDKPREPIIGGCSPSLFFSVSPPSLHIPPGQPCKDSITGSVRIFHHFTRRN